MFDFYINIFQYILFRARLILLNIIFVQFPCAAPCLPHYLRSRYASIPHLFISSIGGNLGSFRFGDVTSSVAGILEHVFGGRMHALLSAMGCTVHKGCIYVVLVDNHRQNKTNKQTNWLEPLTLIYISTSFLLLLWAYFLVFRMKLIISPENSKLVSRNAVWALVNSYSIPLSSSFSPRLLELTHLLGLYTSNKW